MKHIIPFFVFLFLSHAIAAQTNLNPGHKSIDHKYLKPEVVEAVWYALRDTTLIEIGTIRSEVSISKKKIYIVQQIQMKGQSLWIDSTVATYKEFSPLYHSSYNSQRDMVLLFEKNGNVKGYYLDKARNFRSAIDEKIDKPFFDSNLYPALLRVLPLSESYTASLPIFDYNPNNKIGLLQARIVSVKEGTYLSQKLGKRKVWFVTTTDDISVGAEVTHTIDVVSRQVWQQEMKIGQRKMLIKRIE